MTANSCN